MNTDNTKIWAIAIASATLFVVIIPIKVVLLNDVTGFFFGDKLTDILLTFFTAITLIITCNEYKSHRERVKAEVLGQYNERYSRDEHINKVVDYIIRYMDSKPISRFPSTHDTEMFMRFFEEMYIQIVQKRLDEEQVYDLFAFYPIKLVEDENLRISLCISDFDKDYWNNFMAFVNKMKEIRTKRKKNDSEATFFDCRLIEFLYKEVIKDENKWNYYQKQFQFKSFADLYNDPNSRYDFIKCLLNVSEKNSANLLKCLDLLKDKEQSQTETELNGRLRHIVSLFFWGHVLYRNVPIIKKLIECQFKQFVKKGMFEKIDNIQQCFSFMWFLLCIFHDFGYAYEKNLIQEAKVKTKLSIPDGFLPTIYSTDIIEKYANYRHCAFGCNDHGIYGGRVFFDEMLSVGRKIKKDSMLKEIFKTNDVDQIYQYAAWIISCHNIFYNKGNDRYTRCYKCMGLDDFIKLKARYITLENNPLLFLFCLADSIEPTKVLISQNGKSDYEVCKELIIGFNEEKNFMEFDLSKIPCQDVAEKYKEKLKSLNDWLIDVSDDLILKF